MANFPPGGRGPRPLSLRGLPPGMPVPPPRTSRRSSRSRSFSLPSPRALSMERLAARSDVLRENLIRAGVPERAAEFRRERRPATSDTDRDRARPAARPSPKASPLASALSLAERSSSLWSPEFIMGWTRTTGTVRWKKFRNLLNGGNSLQYHVESQKSRALTDECAAASRSGAPQRQLKPFHRPQMCHQALYYCTPQVRAPAPWRS